MIGDEAWVGDAARAAAQAAARPSFSPLLMLAPYLARYRGRAAAALAALMIAALATLVVPIAVRRMIDFGFSDGGGQPDRQYFAVMIAVVAVLAIASALRYYLVTTLGERIVADLRATCSRIIAAVGGFFDTAKIRRADLAADRRHDADQVRRRRLGVDRAAQSRAVPRRRRP